MEIKRLIDILLKIFKLKPVSGQNRMFPQDANGMVTLVCRTNASTGMIPAGSNLEKLLSVANYGNGLTLKDMEVKITPIRLSLSEKAYYLSIFLVLSNEERNFGYSVGYSTQGKCLHITKLSL